MVIWIYRLYHIYKTMSNIISVMLWQHDAINKSIRNVKNIQIVHVESISYQTNLHTKNAWEIFFVSSKYLLHTYVYLIYRYSSTNSLALYRSSSDVRHVVGSVINAKCRNRPTNVDWSHSGLSTSIRSASTLIAILIVRATLMETYGIQKLTQLFDCF